MEKILKFIQEGKSQWKTLFFSSQLCSKFGANIKEI